MSVPVAKARQFAEHVRMPATWVIAARRQLAVAKHLYKHQETLRTAGDDAFEERSGCYYAAYLMAGLAVENAAKAAQVTRDPSTIRDDGSFDKQKLGTSGGHGVQRLVELALGSLSAEEKTLLTKLQEFVVWAGCYTVPLKVDQLIDQNKLQIARCEPLGEQERIESIVARLLQVAGTQ